MNRCYKYKLKLSKKKKFLRLRLFQLKRILEKYFTPIYVFGTYRKLDQTKSTH